MGFFYNLLQKNNSQHPFKTDVKMKKFIIYEDSKKLSKNFLIKILNSGTLGVSTTIPNEALKLPVFIHYIYMCVCVLKNYFSNSVR